MTFRPGPGLAALRSADPEWHSPLLRKALPLSALAGAAWAIGQAASGDLAWAPRSLALSFVSTILLAVATILIFALGLFWLAGFFAPPRVWRRSVALAVYAASPVLLSGALLVMPVMVMACLLACLHALALSYLGVQAVLGCKESEAAFYVAGTCMFCLVASMLFAALCSAAGLV